MCSVEHSARSFHPLGLTGAGYARSSLHMADLGATCTTVYYERS